MKLRPLLSLNEVTLPSSYEDFLAAMNEATDANDYRAFKGLLDAAANKGKHSWIGMWYDAKDETGNVSKQVLKVLNF